MFTEGSRQSARHSSLAQFLFGILETSFAIKVQLEPQNPTRYWFGTPFLQNSIAEGLPPLSVQPFNVKQCAAISHFEGSEMERFDWPYRFTSTNSQSHPRISEIAFILTPIAK